MEDNIRVGIIGSGYIADFHAKAVQAIKGMELSGVVSHKPGKRFQLPNSDEPEPKIKK